MILYGIFYFYRPSKNAYFAQPQAQYRPITLREKHPSWLSTSTWELLDNKIILEKAIHKLLHKIIHDSHNLLFDVKRVVIDNVGLGIGDMK